jgi:hypothetical protein
VVCENKRVLLHSSISERGSDPFPHAWYVTTPDVKFVRLMSYADESDEDDASYIQTCDSKASKSGAVVDSIRVGSESKYDKDDPVQLLAPVLHKSIINASPR